MLLTHGFAVWRILNPLIVTCCSICLEQVMYPKSPCAWSHLTALHIWTVHHALACVLVLKRLYCNFNHCNFKAIQCWIWGRHLLWLPDFHVNVIWKRKKKKKKKTIMNDYWAWTLWVEICKSLQSPIDNMLKSNIHTLKMNFIPQKLMDMKSDRVYTRISLKIWLGFLQVYLEAQLQLTSSVLAIRESIKCAR